MKKGDSTSAQGIMGFTGKGFGEAHEYDSDLVQLCTFFVGDETYVLDIMRIREIINPLESTSVRRSSPIVEGVIDLRGEVIPVVDLRRLLGVEAADKTRSTKQIIASVGKRVVGLVVDSMGRVIVVARSDIKPLPALTPREARFFPGIVNYQGRLHLLLNIKALLSEEGLSSQALSSARRRVFAKGRIV